MTNRATTMEAAKRPVPTSAAEEADALVAQGTALAKEGKRAEAIELFHRAIRVRPDLARGHHNLGVALSEEKDFTQALACFREALRCQANYAEAHYNLGNALGELGRGEEAVLAFKAALRVKPDYVDVLNNLGLALTRLGRPPEASVYLGQAVRLRPDFPEGHNNLGLANMERGDFAAAEACYREALRLNPRYTDAHTNLGSAFKEQGRLEEAVACYELALAYEPDSATTRWNRSLAWLQMGNYEQGWPEYEWRWQRKGTRALPEPRWDGAAFPGRTVMVHAEQGMGDVLQFLRYVPMVKERGGSVIVAVPPDLVSLAATCPGADEVVAENGEMPACDMHVALMSLAGIFGTSLATVPAKVPYLGVDEGRVGKWRARLGVINPAPNGARLANTGGRVAKVGIAWQGNTRHKWDRHRSFPLAHDGAVGSHRGGHAGQSAKGDRGGTDASS